MRVSEFLLQADCRRDAEGNWDHTVLETVDAGPNHEIVKDRRDGSRYSLEPINEDDPEMVPA